MKFQISTKKIKSDMRLKVKKVMHAHGSAGTELEVEFRDNEGRHLGDLVLQPTGVTWFKGSAWKHGKQLPWEEVFDRKGKRLIAF